MRIATYVEKFVIFGTFIKVVVVLHVMEQRQRKYVSFAQQLGKFDCEIIGSNSNISPVVCPLMNM